MITIQQAKEEIKQGIESYLLKDEKGNYVLPEVYKLPFYLIGAPGIGKTQIVEQVAKELNIGFVSTSITHHSRNTVLGLPVITELQEESGQVVKYTKYTMSEILAAVKEEYEAGQKEGILLLDEFASMAESLVAPMLAFLQTKNIGSYVLPEGWTIVLCANPPKYNRTAREFDAAIMDRVRLMRVEFNAKVFLNYGAKAGMHKGILEYLKVHKDAIQICSSDNKELVTARGWENLSRNLLIYEQLKKPVTPEMISQFIKSEKVAQEFYGYYITMNLQTSFDLFSSICNGEDLPKSISVWNEQELGAQYGILSNLKQMVIDGANTYKSWMEAFMNLQKTYKNLKERQEATPDVWDYGRVLQMHAKGVQSFEKATEEDIFGLDVKSAWHQNYYKMLAQKINKREQQQQIVTALTAEKQEGAGKNVYVLETMKTFIQEVKQELISEMGNVDQRITNILTFLDHSQENDETFLEMFIEGISQEESVLNLLILVKNEAFGKAVSRINQDSGILPRMNAEG